MLATYRTPAFVRLFGNAIPDPATGCRLWLGPLSPDGFGLIRDDSGAVVTIQRLAYKLAIGPIPAGRYPHQTCGIDNCVSPDHLELGTRGGQQQKRRPKIPY